jgi:hypothetical protein
MGERFTVEQDTQYVPDRLAVTKVSDLRPGAYRLPKAATVEIGRGTTASAGRYRVCRRRQQLIHFVEASGNFFTRLGHDLAREYAPKEDVSIL